MYTYIYNLLSARTSLLKTRADAATKEVIYIYSYIYIDLFILNIDECICLYIYIYVYTTSSWRRPHCSRHAQTQRRKR